MSAVSRRSVPALRLLGLMSLLVLGLILAACGAENGGSTAPTVPSAGAPAAPAPGAKPQSGSGTTSSATSGSAAAPERMVVRNGQIALQVKDVGGSVAAITQLAEANGGYVRSSQIDTVQRDDQDVPEGRVTIAVRADSYDAVMGRLRGMATKVDSESSTAQDVTDQYVDLDANLRNLQASEDQLLKLMDKAQTVNDILAVQQQLTTVRGQIQQLQAQKQLLDRQIALSTIQVTLQPPPVEPSDQVWQPLQTGQQAWKSSLVTIRVFADVLISVVVFSWWLIPIAALGVFLYRRQRRRPSVSAS
ncbi:MAG TPA: DUF4349 domain-containing protein [Chloroflexota bacterium]|nr:DUF4349 domain-containing protein [Chloroflexota bacterium]